MADGDGIKRPQIFGAGVSLGMFAGILIGSLVTLWLGEAAMDLAHRMLGCTQDIGAFQHQCFGHVDHGFF